MRCSVGSEGRHLLVAHTVNVHGRKGAELPVLVPGITTAPTHGLAKVGVTS